MTAPTGPLIRTRDISGNRFPKGQQPLGDSASTANAVPVSRPAEFEPLTGVSQEFIISFSTVVANNSTAALFTVDGAGNVLSGAARLLAPNTRARVSGVIIEGDTILGIPVLFFSLRADILGTQRYTGWEGVGLPGRGGIVNVGIEPFTIIPQGNFFGAFVQNTDGAPHYASIIMQGWTI